MSATGQIDGPLQQFRRAEARAQATGSDRELAEFYRAQVDNAYLPTAQMAALASYHATMAVLAAIESGRER